MRIVWVVIALLVGSCQTNYQKQYSGNVPLRVQNRSSHEVEVHIAPEGTTDMGRRWGKIATGQSDVFKVKPGNYTVMVAVLDWQGKPKLESKGTFAGRVRRRRPGDAGAAVREPARARTARLWLQRRRRRWW